MAKKAPIVIAEVIEKGNLGLKKDMALPEIIQECANCLDAHEACEIMGGGILFKAQNGRYYTICIEATISVADKSFVDAVLAEKNS